MGDILIVNASPIICLAKAGFADLLIRTSGKVFVPDSVIAEILCGPNDDAGRHWIESGAQFFPISVKEIHPSIQKWQLGRGESSVIQVGLEKKASAPLLGLDDYRARSAAESLGLGCRGSIGVLIEAKRLKILDSISGPLGKLSEAGLHIHPLLHSKVLKIVGEA